MKPGFSFNDAVGAPFGVLKRRPFSVFVWGVLMVAVMAAMYSLFIPLFANIAANPGAEEAFDAYMLESIRLQAAINGLNIVMYLVMLLVWTAAGRATLSPHRGDGFAFLRLGMDEVRVAVAVLAIFIGWYIVVIVAVLLGVGIALSLWAVDHTVAIVATSLCGLLVLVASVWGWLRTCLIAPASLVLKRFAFAEGWALTRGQVWKLLGLNLVVWLIYMVAAILAYVLVGGVLLGGFLGQGLDWPTDIQSAADLEPVVRPMIVPAILAALPLAFGMGWLMTLYAAPHVVAARQLLDGVPAAPEDGL